MMIQCPGCAARYQVKPGGIGPGARARCPKCSLVFIVGADSGAAPAVGPPVAGNQILVVDDARFFRETIVDVLQPLQRTILTAPDAEAALEIVMRQRPVLVILDLNLPGMNGYELIRRIRAAPGGATIKLLVLSGVFRKDADAQEVKRVGADDFMSKSFKPEQLLARVRGLIGG